MKPVLLTDFVDAVQKIDPAFTFETNFFDDDRAIPYDLFTITWRGEPVTFMHYRRALDYVVDIYNFLTQ